MDEFYFLEWEYTPFDYFEEITELVCDCGVISLENGQAKLNICSSIYPSDQSLRSSLHEKLEYRFQIAQVFNYKSYSLSKPRVSLHSRDGVKSTWIFPDDLTVKIIFGDVDVVVRDSAGDIISDSRSKRMKDKNRFDQIAVKNVDNSVVRKMLGSLGAAINDPDNEFVYLYEVVECLEAYFGGETKSVDILGFDIARWRRLGKLTNNKKLTQGRHRGRHLKVMRGASSSELSEAKELACEMIESYLIYLDRQQVKVVC